MDYLRLIMAAAMGVLLSVTFDHGALPGSLPNAMAHELQSILSMSLGSYRNCAAARAAGAAPLRRGDPGYATWLDSDNDGIGCE